MSSSEELSSIPSETIEDDQNIEQFPQADVNALNSYQIDQDEAPEPTYVADPTQKDLEFNPEAYDCFLKFNLDWPLLSLDFITLQNNADENAPFFFLGGSQTDGSERPAISVLKINNARDYAPGDDPEADLENFDIEPAFERRIFDCQSNILRVKSNTAYLNNMYSVGNGGVIAYWEENGCLEFGSIDEHLRSLQAKPSDLKDYNNEQSSFLQEQNGWCGYYPISPKKQQFEYTSPGYALDFHPLQSLCIAGNQDNIINAFSIAESGEVCEDSTNFSFLPEGSIEDLRFAHTGEFLISGVFGAVSTCGQFELVDPRAPDSKIIQKISTADLNVFDFDYSDQNMLYIGDDAGAVYEYDLRSMQRPLSVIKYQKTPITSLKASPTNQELIATADDNSVCLWEFGCQDEENAALLREQRLPEEFLFLHLGVEEVREIAWCGREDGYLAISDAGGLQLVRSSNMI